MHWLEDFERWVVAIDSDDGEIDSEITRPPLVPVGGQFATALDALPPAVSTTIAAGEGPPGAGAAAGSALPVAIATLEGVRQESLRMRVKPRNVCPTGLEPRTTADPS